MPPAGLPVPPASLFSAPVPYVRSTINALPAVSDGQMQERALYDRLESIVATLASMITTIVQANQGQLAISEPLPAPIMALPTPAPLLLVGEGPAPPGYIGVGTSPEGRPL
jgi:hypothetical protein